MLNEELARMRAVLLNQPGAIAGALTHLSEADNARAAEIVSRAVDDLFATLRSGDELVRDMAAIQIGEAEAAAR